MLIWLLLHLVYMLNQSCEDCYNIYWGGPEDSPPHVERDLCLFEDMSIGLCYPDGTETAYWSVDK
jgi:hypothetical protein